MGRTERETRTYLVQITNNNNLMGFDTRIEDDMKHIVGKFTFFCERNREEESKKKARKNEGKKIVSRLLCDGVHLEP